MAAVLTALSDRLFRSRPYAFGAGNRIAPTAVVEGCLEGDVTVGAGAYVGPGSFIGAGTRIGPNAVIEAHCHIGKNCVIQAGAVIGCAGFGFFARPPGSQSSEGEDRGPAPMPHPAGVEIGDGCWIGANSVVAAGVLEPTGWAGSASWTAMCRSPTTFAWGTAVCWLPSPASPDRPWRAIVCAWAALRAWTGICGWETISPWPPARA